MFFVISKAIEWVLDPTALLALAVLGSFCASLLGRRRLAFHFTCVSVVILVSFGVLPVSTWLSLPLESRFPYHPPLPAKVTGVIVLGGTERLSQSAAWGEPTIGDPAPLAAFLVLARKYPDARLVFTGGARARHDETLSEAVVAEQFLEELGESNQIINYEDRSRNTYENAILTRELIKPKAGETWILVCQAIAMPRAIGIFRAAGWNVIPFPAGYLGSRNPGLSLSFNILEGFELAGIALHEWGGLIVYRLMHYTNELFPGSRSDPAPSPVHP